MGLALIDAASINSVRKFIGIGIGIGSQSEYGVMSGKITEPNLPLPTSKYGAAKDALQVLTS